MHTNVCNCVRGGGNVVVAVVVLCGDLGKRSVVDPGYNTDISNSCH